MNQENKVYYLGHSAWAVEMPTCYLLFDCQDENARRGGRLAEGYADVGQMADKPVYIFFSHRHHDHYSRVLHQANAETGAGVAVLGGFASPLPRTVTVRPRERRDVEGVTVYTAASTDEGVCFLVQAQGLTVFFAGDHADWGDGAATRALYYKEIDYIAGLGLPVDIAFIPVCTFSGQRPADMTQGAIYAIDALKPALTFPMHANGREQLYEAFAQDLRQAGSDARVVCAKEKGEVRV